MLSGADAVRELLWHPSRLKVASLLLCDPARDALIRADLAPGHTASLSSFVVFQPNVGSLVDIPDAAEAALRSIRHVLFQAGGVGDWGAAARVSNALLCSTVLDTRALGLCELASIVRGSNAPGARLHLLGLRGASASVMMRGGPDNAAEALCALAPCVEIAFKDWSLGDPAAAVLIAWLLRRGRAVSVVPSREQSPASLAHFTLTQTIVLRLLLADGGQEHVARFGIRFDHQTLRAELGTPRQASDAEIAAALAALTETERSLWRAYLPEDRQL